MLLLQANNDQNFWYHMCKYMVKQTQQFYDFRTGFITKPSASGIDRPISEGLIIFVFEYCSSLFSFLMPPLQKYQTSAPIITNKKVIPITTPTMTVILRLLVGLDTGEAVGDSGVVADEKLKFNCNKNMINLKSIENIKYFM